MTAKQLYQLHSQLFLISFPELPQSEHISVADATWVALNVVSGGSNTSTSQPIGVTKIAKSVIAPLADHNISVFMLSTYQTDFILVSVNIVHVKVLCVNGVGLDSHVMLSKKWLDTQLEGLEPSQLTSTNTIGLKNGCSLWERLAQKPLKYPF